jgi:hypothetical protein
MLEGSLREATQLREQGFVEIALPDPEDDPTAMMIIIGILYGKTVDLPETVEISLLEKIATITDKYEWHELVTPFGIDWFDKIVLQDGLPSDFNDKLLDWLWISWVFGHKENFKSLSKTAQQYAPTPINTRDENIRLPKSILGE